MTTREYIGRIEAYCAGFSTFPERGTVRPDVRARVRIISFKRRVTIAFTVKDYEVVILRVLCAGRSLDLAFSGDEP